MYGHPTVGFFFILLHSWLKNITDNLYSFDIGLPEAKQAAQIQYFWRFYALLVLYADIALAVQCEVLRLLFSKFTECLPTPPN